MIRLTALTCALVACTGDPDVVDYAQLESSLIAKEDSKTTQLMRDKMSAMRKAFDEDDADRYRKELRELLVDAVKQDAPELVKRYASLQVIAAEELDGYQPIVYRYAKSIFGLAYKVDPSVIKDLRADVMRRRTTQGDIIAAPCRQVVLDALRGDLPEIDDLAGLSCLEEDPVVQSSTLTPSGVRLAGYDACARVQQSTVYTFNVPSSIPTSDITALEMIDLPFPHTLTWWQDWTDLRWVSVYAKRHTADPLPIDAQTSTFKVRVKTTAGDRDYPVTFTINPGMRNRCGSSSKIVVGIGSSGTRPIYGNGSPTPRSWSAGTGLPSGLSFAPGSGTYANHAVVTGTVQPNARNSRLDVAFQQGTAVVSRQFDFEVTLRADPARVAQLAAAQRIARGQVVSIPLPSGAGADGTYTWAVDSSNALPAGLSLVRNGTSWSIAGTVASNAPLALRTVRLRLSSAGQSVVLDIAFDLSREVKLFVQNMILFTPEIVNSELMCLPALILGPFAYGGCIALLEIVEEIFYNGAINNTEADNEQRATLLSGHIASNQYDIVALQEVWEGPQTSAELDEILADLAPTYHGVVGPGTSFALIPPEFKINSGLLTLAKHPTSGDVARVFTTTGDGVDGMANKGFVATRVALTNQPDEFVWVINTHTNAEDTAVRAAQLAQIAAFAATLPATNPILIVGDLNVRADESGASWTEYAHMMVTLDRFQDFGFGAGLVTHSWNTSAYAQNWHPDTPEPDQRIDYVLVRQGTQFGLVKDSISIVGNNPMTAVSTDLCGDWNLASTVACHFSDHFGQQATLRFRRW